jgi:hypothetical protein
MKTDKGKGNVTERPCKGEVSKKSPKEQLAKGS